MGDRGRKRRRKLPQEGLGIDQTGKKLEQGRKAQRRRREEYRETTVLPDLLLESEKLKDIAGSWRREHEDMENTTIERRSYEGRALMSARMIEWFGDSSNRQKHRESIQSSYEGDRGEEHRKNSSEAQKALAATEMGKQLNLERGKKAWASFKSKDDWQERHHANTIKSAKTNRSHAAARDATREDKKVFATALAVCGFSVESYGLSQDDIHTHNWWTAVHHPERYKVHKRPGGATLDQEQLLGGWLEQNFRNPCPASA